MSATPTWLQDLNPEQLRAVTTKDGPLLILAGAGSGKTRVLTRRMAHLLDQGVAPWEILAVTFTNKAAAEMKQRVAELLADGPYAAFASRMVVSTFHSACVRFLRQDVDAIGLRKDFSVYDADDQNRLLKAVMAAERVDPKAHTPRSLRGKIDAAKNKMKSPDDVAAELRSATGDPTVRVYRAYENGLREANAVDFNDLVNLVVKLWSEHPAVLRRYQRRFRYLMVDEYQDTNRAQYLLVKLLAFGTPDAPGHRNVAVVGDDDQSIYAFRGADVQNILDFDRDFPDAAVVRLEQNYRSTGHILAAAGGVVKNNFGRMDKTLWTDLGDGDPVRQIVASDTEDEAQRVVDDLVDGVRRGDHRYGDVAIIYRTNQASRAFEVELVRRRIPHVLVGARKFYERREVKDLLAYLKLALNPADDMSAQRVWNEPSRGLGAKAQDELRALAADRGVPLLAAMRVFHRDGKGRAARSAGQFVEAIDRIAEQALIMEPGELVLFAAEVSGYAQALRQEDSDEGRDRWQNVEELARAAESQVDDLFFDPEQDAPGAQAHGPLSPADRLRAFIDRGALAGQADELPGAEGEGRVTLLTAHLAKGLEFPTVYVIGMTEGGFPHFMSLEKDEDIEEERRLVYVAFTRARRRLVLARPRKSLVPGTGYRDAMPSRFLREIPPAALGAVSGARFGSQAPSAGQSWRAPAPPSTRRTSSPAAPPPQRTLFSSPAAAPPPVQSDGPIRTRQPEHLRDLDVGVRVLHPQFGAGVIRLREGAPANPKLHIHFDGVGRKRVYAIHAHLEILLS